MAKVKRHRTAISRSSFSAPIHCLLRDELLNDERDLFDFGCGRGRDLELLKRKALKCRGWDPAFRPNNEKTPAAIVNRGFVINVIESPEERSRTLREAWELARQLFVVSAQIRMPGRGSKTVEFGDGILTSRDTFQKYYSQAELREYIENILDERACPAALGVFYVFRCPELRDSYLTNRYRRRSAAPRRKLSEKRFEEHKDLLQALMDSVTQLGRLPLPSEFESHSMVQDEFVSLKRAFALIRRVTGAEEWEEIRKERSEDLLVYLALAKFERRARYSDLPEGQQRDVKEFFGSYTTACKHADELLFSAGNEQLVDDASRKSTVGKLLPRALYVHRSARGQLPPILRVYEGCASDWIGEIEGTNLVKLHRHTGKVSYVSYPTFDSDPHPELLRTVKVHLRSLSLNCYNYAGSANPPVLHRKETFVADDYEGKSKFARLTAQEERHGLFDDTSTIGTRDGWEERLRLKGFQLRGHRLIRANGS